MIYLPILSVEQKGGCEKMKENLTERVYPNLETLLQSVSWHRERIILKLKTETATEMIYIPLAKLTCKMVLLICWMLRTL